MHYGSKFLPPWAALGAIALLLPVAQGAADDHSRTVVFNTTDGVELKGTFYPAEPDPASAGAKEAVVLLLHDIDKDKGGGSRQDGWDDLAAALQKEGYPVLSFDFRGFGDSRGVSASFWKQPASMNYIRGAGSAKANTALDHKNFDNNSSKYYPMLVNDVAAAKAYLDRQNDKGKVNTSSLIVVGAGEGATIGAMWMASEWRRQKATAAVPGGKPVLDDPEGRDQAAAVWLGVRTKLGGMEVSGAVHSWLAETSGGRQVPMAFVCGADDDAAEAVAEKSLAAITNRIKKDNPGWSDDKVQQQLQSQCTNVRAIKDLKLAGSELLTEAKTRDWIVKTYLAAVMKGRGNKESRKRDVRDEEFLWTFPGAPVVPAKGKGEDNPRLVPVDLLLKGGGN